MNIPVVANNGGHVKTDFLVLPESRYAMSRATFSPDLFEKMPTVKYFADVFKARYGVGIADWTRDIMTFLVICDAINRAGSTDPEA